VGDAKAYLHAHGVVVRLDYNSCGGQA
jgi:hypothetical protein